MITNMIHFDGKTLGIQIEKERIPFARIQYLISHDGKKAYFMTLIGLETDFEKGKSYDLPPTHEVKIETKYRWRNRIPIRYKIAFIKRKEL